MKKLSALILTVFIMLISVGCVRPVKVPVGVTDPGDEISVGMVSGETATEKTDTAVTETTGTDDTEEVPEPDSTSAGISKDTRQAVSTAVSAPKDTDSQQTPANNSAESFVPESEDNRPMGKDTLHRYRLGNDMGSSRFFNGNIDVYCFFIDDDESSWDGDVSSSFMTTQIKPALNFLVNQAAKWGVTLSFNIKSYYNGDSPFSLKYNGTVNKNLAVGGSTKDIFNQVAVNMGYASDDDFALSDRESSDKTDEVYLFFVCKSGVSYARNMYSKSETYHVYDEDSEHAVSFRKNLSSPTITLSYMEQSDTIAHEILHLFGGEDFYGEERIRLAERFCRSDIMLMDYSDLDQMEVTEMTAFSIGWTNNIPELCYNQTWIDGGY